MANKDVKKDVKKASKDTSSKEVKDNSSKLEKKAKREGHRIIKCTCKGTAPMKFQDERYGLGMRVANVCSRTAGGGYSARCTCCAKEHVIR